MATAGRFLAKSDAVTVLFDEKTYTSLTHIFRIHNDGRGLLIKTRDADRFYLMLNHIALNGIEIESVAPADDDVNSVYEYLIGNEEVVR